MVAAANLQVGCQQRQCVLGCLELDALQHGLNSDLPARGMSNRKVLEHHCGFLRHHISGLSAIGSLNNDEVEKKSKDRRGLDSDFETEVLFVLPNGQMVHKGELLWHPDPRVTLGKPLVAEFEDEGGWVTVRHQNGAVPRVRVCELEIYKDHCEY